MPLIGPLKLNRHPRRLLGLSWYLCMLIREKDRKMFLSLRYFQIFLAVIGHCRCCFWWSYQWMGNWQVWSQGFHTTLRSSFWVGVASHQQCAESRHALHWTCYNRLGLWNDFIGCSGKLFSRGAGDTLDFRWQGWLQLNGGKTQSPKKSLGLPTKPQIVLGPKFNPPKNPMPNFPAIKISKAIKMMSIMTLQIVVNTPQKNNLYLNQAAGKNTYQNFPTQKNPKIENFKPKKVLQSSLSLEIQRGWRGEGGGCFTMSPRVCQLCIVL